MAEDLPRRRRILLTGLSILLLCVGDTGGPLLLRLYFLHGGRRTWLPAFLQTAGFPFLLPLLLPLLRRRNLLSSPLLLLLLASSALGLLTGLDDFLYAYALALLPVLTAVVLTATHLAFTALFAFLLLRQRFTPFSVNAIALLTVGAGVLALRADGDRPAGVSPAGYWKGFVLTVGAAALYGLVLPLVELAYAKAGTLTVGFTLVIQTQFVMGFFATAFCVVGMIVDGDFQGIRGEAERYGLGERKYYLVLIWCAVLWQCFFVGAVGVIFCVNTLLAAVIIASLIPVVEILGVVFLHEKFSGEKAVALILSLWGLASYSYGEHRRRRRKDESSQSPIAPAAHELVPSADV